MTTLAEHKAALRKHALALRHTFDPTAGHALAAIVRRDLAIPPGAIIAGVWPLQGEMDLRPLLHALHAQGHPIVLPETPPRGQPLIFRSWTPDTPMVTERFGTQRPDGPVAIPDLIFVPLLAFDRRGYRLGYGGGYYDRTLHALPSASAIGFGYAAQRVDAIPAEAHDVPLGQIATELGIVRASHE
jgi:5-formyltetrahydrofolate cyclo-ligase